MDSSMLCSCEDSLAMASIPSQTWCEPYDWSTALTEGTIFPCLNLTFYKAPATKTNEPLKNSISQISLNNREELLNSLNAISFAINDLTLYLDTHPDCPNGTTLFYQLLEQRFTLLSNFANQFYPLTQTSLITGNYDQTHYGWCEGPMPWEGACL